MAAFKVTFHNADKNTFTVRKGSDCRTVWSCKKVQIHQNVFHKKTLNLSLILIQSASDAINPAINHSLLLLIFYIERVLASANLQKYMSGSIKS